VAVDRRDSAIRFFITSSYLHPKDDVPLPFYLVCRSIRRERGNASIFEALEKNVSRLVSEIKDETRLWAAAGAKHLSPL
jgi:hypothetical protein